MTSNSIKNVIMSIKYNIWTTSDYVNKKLSNAYSSLENIGYV